MRGLACVLMFQTHCYDSWLGGAARKSTFFRWSQMLGTLPAPLFLFIAGISFALMLGKLQRKGLAAGQITRATLLRGGEILGLGLLFRVQEYALGWGWSPWTDLFRVDILNNIGVSIVLMAAVCGVTLRWKPAPHMLLASALASTAAIAMLTPLLWTTWQPRWLPWPLESYINGVHNLGAPQPWLFPVFPWTAFAFAGLAVGLVLFGDAGQTRPAALFAGIAGSGAAVFFLAYRLDLLPVQLYPVYDFWHTSPNFFLMRVGVLMGIFAAVYAWCRWGAGRRGFSPLIQLGTTSLLIYWVHIEFVYGRVSILPKRGQSVGTASAGLAAIFLAMLGLSRLRTRLGRKW
jgi:uncharacterized membrane protein